MGLTRLRSAYETAGYVAYEYVRPVLKGPHRKMHLRNLCCKLGLHWRVTFWEVHGGYSSPPEADWACTQCGHCRLPYRAWLWSTPIGRWIR